eukprot:2696967-Amphidinium_carterae.1
MKKASENERLKEEKENINETYQDLYYEPIQNSPDDAEMEKMEYQPTQQYLHYRIYPETTIHSQKKRENMSTTSQKPSTTTAEFYSTP